MEFSVKSGSPEKQRSACIVVGVFEPRRLSPIAEQLDKISDGYISALLRRGELEGKPGQTILLHHVPNIVSERVLLIGCGKERELDERQYKQVIQKTINTLNDTGSMEAVCFLTELHVKGRNNYWKVRQAVETAKETLYSFDQLKTNKSEPRRPLRKMVFNVPTRRELTSGERAIQHGLAIAAGIKAAKDLGNMPPNICNAAYLASQARQLADTYSKNVITRVIGEQQMKELGMNSYLAVGNGSQNESLMSVIEYKGNPAEDARPIVLVGKGLTFDSGGISIKPSEGMDEMKYDMCGAAAVYGVMRMVAELQLPLNVVGVLAGCENMPGGRAYRPGDVLTTMSGQTVEVLNTDAEGRLVLKLAHACAPSNLKWIEECLPPQQYEGYRELKRNAPAGMMVTSGEHHGTLQSFRTLSETGIDIMQPDVGWCGGLTTLVEIAAIAKSRGQLVVPHGSSVYSHHAVITFTNTPFSEFLMTSPDCSTMRPQFDPILVDEPVPVNGRIHKTVLDKPGFGVELNRDCNLKRPYNH